MPCGDLDDLLWLKELVCVAGITVFAAELAAAIRIDGPLERKIALADRAVQQGFGAHGTKLDLVPLVGVGGLSGEPGHADGLGGQNRKEGGRILGLCRLHFRHFFASVRSTVRL